MTTILLLLLLAVVIIAYRIYRIKTYINELAHYSDLRLILPYGFYLEQAIVLFSASLFLTALSPVPALYAVAAVFGVLMDTILTVFYYSAKYSRKYSSSSNITA